MTMLNDENSFVIFGGLTQVVGKISNKLWHYSISEEKWTLKAKKSIIQPPGLSKHTLTLAGDYLYLFGGSLSHGEFSNKMYRIGSKNLTDWELIQPEGNMANLYITAHSMVFYEEQQTLILFGGLKTDVGRFAKLSGNITVWARNFKKVQAKKTREIK